MSVNDDIKEHLNIFFNNKSNIMKEVVEYVMKDGKRIRPLISYNIYSALTKDNIFKYCFLSIEYIHTSSLIIDDLPCMDNADIRRNNICIHKKYGEAIAQLATAFLLSLSTHAFSYEINNLVKNKLLTTDKANEITMYFLSKFSDILSTTSEGQLLDLEYSNADIGTLLKDISSKITVEEIITKKTESLFSICFELPWICAVGTSNLDKIQSLSHSFSMAFQIVDDIQDREEDFKTNKKNINQNYALRYGLDIAIRDANNYLNKFKEQLIELCLYNAFFEELIQNLSQILCKQNVIIN